MESVNTIQLIKWAGQGDGDAQALLYRQYNKAMFNICIRMTGSQADAEDVLQDVFILAFKSLRQLKQPENFGGWLKRITLNECIRYSKRYFRWKDLENHHHNFEDETTEWWTTINVDLVHQEIKGLPDGCRQVFVLYVLEDYAHRDIAVNLGISEGTSKSQYHRARQLLKERITKQMANHG